MNPEARSEQNAWDAWDGVRQAHHRDPWDCSRRVHLDAAHNLGHRPARHLGLKAVDHDRKLAVRAAGLRRRVRPDRKVAAANRDRTTADNWKLEQQAAELAAAARYTQGAGPFAA